MKYTSKEQVIEAAQKAGSTAKTYKGAAKYLAKIRPAQPLEKRGNKWMYRSTKRTAYKNNKRGDRILKALNLMSYKEALEYADRLTAPLLKAAAAAIRGVSNAGHYRRAHSSWAGGSHFVDCSLTSTSPSANGYSERVWSDNGKWSGNNSTLRIQVTWRTLLDFPTLILADTNYIIIDAEPTECSDVLKVTVLEQGRGFAVRAVAMWYVIGKGVYNSQKQAHREACRISKVAA